MSLMTEVVNIPVTQIVANPYQPRKIFSDEELQDLADSIKSIGLIQPITVRQVEDHFEIVVGERRFRAVQMAGLDSISAVVATITDEQSAVMALIENIQRQDLNFIEEAEALLQLMENHGFTQKTLAERIGKNQSTVSNKLRVLTLPDDVKDILVNSGLTERHGRALLKLRNDADIRQVVKAIVKNELTVKSTEKLIESILNETEEEPAKKQNVKYNINYKIYINTIKQAYDAIANTGANIKYAEKDKGEYVEVTLRIPKE